MKPSTYKSSLNNRLNTNNTSSNNNNDNVSNNTSNAKTIHIDCGPSSAFWLRTAFCGACLNAHRSKLPALEDVMQRGLRMALSTWELPTSSSLHIVGGVVRWLHLEIPCKAFEPGKRFQHIQATRTHRQALCWILSA